MTHQTMGVGDTTILTVHGIQGTCAAWLPVAEVYGSKASFISANLRGRGDAFRGQGPQDYSLQAYARDLQQVVHDQVDTAPFILAGWSMGVSVILEYLRQADAARPHGLILLSGTPALSLTHWFASEGEQLLIDVAEREKRLGLLQAADHQAVVWTWEAIRCTDHRSDLAAIEIPTLVIHGSEDKDSPVEHAQWMAEGIPHADLHIIEGAGHSLLANNTAAVVRKISDFISTFTHA